MIVMNAVLPVGARRAARRSTTPRTSRAVFAALADPVRLRLLSLVADAGEICSCDLLEPLGKSQPTISSHGHGAAEGLVDRGVQRADVGHQRGEVGPNIASSLVGAVVVTVASASES